MYSKDLMVMLINICVEGNDILIYSRFITIIRNVSIFIARGQYVTLNLE